MAYEKYVWQDGDYLTTARMNHIEEAIEQLSENPISQEELTSAIDTAVGNIGADSLKAISYDHEQAGLTDAQKEIARNNMNVYSREEAEALVGADEKIKINRNNNTNNINYPLLVSQSDNPLPNSSIQGQLHTDNSKNPTINYSTGVLAANAFAGDGTQLTNIDGTKIINGAGIQNLNAQNIVNGILEIEHGGTGTGTLAAVPDRLKVVATTTLAPAFDENTVYSKNDYCTNITNNRIYRCIADTSQGTWDNTSSNWEGPVVFSSIIADIDNKATTNVVSMGAATSTTNGTGGLVPAPQAGDEGKFLGGDAQWHTVDAGVTGVKGNNEDNYRVGQVNLTPANLGAASAEDLANAISAIAEQYDEEIEYNTGNYCIYNNKLYRCIANEVVDQQPDTEDSEYWEEATVMGSIVDVATNLNPESIGAASVTDLAARYSDSAEYEIGDYCTYNGHLYKCKADVSGTAPVGGNEDPYWAATTVDEAMVLAAEAAAAAAGGVVKYTEMIPALSNSEQLQARTNISAASLNDITVLNGSITGLSTSVSNLSNAVNNLSNTVANVTRTQNADALTISYNGNIPSTQVSIATDMPLKNITYSTDTNKLYFWNIEEPTSEDLTDNTKQVFDPVFIQGGGGGAAQVGTITITRITDLSVSAVLGETVPISFTIAATDTGGDSIIATNPGDPIGTSNWYINNILVASNINITSGNNTFDITPYLTAGNQTVKIQVSIDTGGESLQTATKTWNVNLINMYFTWTYNDAQINTGAFTDTWIPYGSISKTTHTKLDTTELDTITTTLSGAQQSITIPAQQHGVHSIERWLSATVNGVEKTTLSQYHEIICVEAGNNTPIIAVGQKSTTMQQYNTLRIPYTVYNPTSGTSQITLSVDNAVIATTEVDRTTQYWFYTPTDAGAHTLTITCGSVSRTINITVTAVVLEDVSEKSGYDFKFKASEFATNSAVRNWSSNGITATYSNNFDWINGGLHTEEDENGNLQQYFCVRAGTTMTINYKLFGNTYDPKELGKNFKFIFKAVNCRTYDAEVLSCYDSTIGTNGIGLRLTANEGTLNTLNETLTTYYCKDSYIEFETNIHPDSERPYLQFWIDGTPENTILYDKNTDSMQQGQQTQANITIGSNNCDVYIYLIKAYPTYATNNEEVSNFIMDAPNTSQMVQRYNRNNILTDGEVDYNKLASLNPDLRILLLDLESMTHGKEDTDEVLAHTVRYIHRGGGDSDCFTISNCGVKVQGTSSVGYLESAGNLDINFKYGRQVYNTEVTTGEIIFDDGTHSQKGYSMTNIQTDKLTKVSIPVDYMNVKVNVASSENANNACIADWYNTYQPWLSPARKKNANARDTMEFVPGALFIKDRSGELFGDTSKYHFYGICDIGNSKKNTKVFHDTSNPLACCVEVANNTSLPCLMKQKTYDWDGKKAKIIEEGKSQTVFEFRHYDKSMTSAIQVGWDRFVSFMYDNNPNLATNNALSQAVTFTPYTFKGWGTYDTSTYDNDNVIYLYGYGPSTYVAASYETDTEAEKCYYYINYSNDYIYSSDGTNWTQIEQLTWTRDTKNVLGGTTISTYAGTYTHDTFEYRMACLLQHCEEYMIMDPVVYHFIFIESFLMTDNVAKNTFWSSDDLIHWEPSKDYDNDTALGNDNVGGLSFTYGLETDDIIGSSYVFNAHDAAWITFIRGLFDACQTMYRDRESSGCFDSTVFLDKLKTWQATRPERLWVADAQRKYLRPYEDNGTKTYLPMLAGRKTHQREQVKIYNSYYYASKYVSTFCTGTNIMVRGNTPTSGETITVVPPMNKATLTMYINCYIVITSTSNNVVAKRRATRGIAEEMDFTTVGSMNETELYFCSAGMITEISGLAHLYFKQNNFNDASNLQRLEIGSNITGYANPNLEILAIGDNNKMLEYLDVRNCPNASGALDLTKCISLKELYLDNTAFTGISIAPGGLLTTISLQAPTSITLSELLYLTNITISDISNLTTLRIENCLFDDAAALTIDGVTTTQNNKDLILTLIEAATNLSRIRLLGVNWYTSTTLLNRLYNMAGINDNSYDIAQSVITGEAEVLAASARQISLYNSVWPDFDVTPDDIITEYLVTFLNADGTPIKDKNGNNYVQYIAQGNEAYNPITANEINIPTLDETAQYTYTFSGWDNLTGIVNTAKTVTATYTKTIRTYTVRWFDRNNGNLLDSATNVAYGNSASYSQTYPPTITDQEATQRQYVFLGWDKSTSYITGNIDVYATWSYSGSLPAIGTDLKDMSLSDIYGIAASKTAGYWTPGDYYDIQVGRDFNYSNVESQTLISTPTYFDGTAASVMIFNGENELPKIELFTEDAPSFTLAIDYEFIDSSVNTCLASCGDGTEGSGFRLRYETNPTIIWGNSNNVVGNGFNRNILVIRHNQVEGYTRQLIINYHNNNSYYVDTNLSNVLARSGDGAYTTDGCLVLGGIAAYDNNVWSTGARGKGWIHWCKIWYQDLGSNDCQELACWPHETWRMEYTGPGKDKNNSGLDNSKTMGEFFLNNPLSLKHTIDTPANMTNFFNKVYNALPIGWKSIIKQVAVKSITGYNNGNATITTNMSKLYIPAIAEIDSSYSSSIPYSSELNNDSSNYIIKTLTEDKKRIKFPGVILDNDVTIIENYSGDSDPTTSATQSNPIVSGKTIWVRSNLINDPDITAYSEQVQISNVGYIFFNKAYCDQHKIICGRSVNDSNNIDAAGQNYIGGKWIMACTWWTRTLTYNDNYYYYKRVKPNGSTDTNNWYDSYGHPTEGNIAFAFSI